MHKKWIIIIGIIVLIVIGVIALCFKNVETEIIPESEIENKDLRNTIISLFFIDKETKALRVETRLVDSKDLLKHPYEKLIEMLIAGPENNLYESAIPNDTKVISTQLNNECLTVDLSKEFLNISNENNELYNAIYQIVDTVTELKEVNRVKLLVEGEDSESYLKNEYVRTN